MLACRKVIFHSPDPAVPWTSTRYLPGSLDTTDWCTEHITMVRGRLWSRNVTKQNVIVRICKSEAKVTNNKKILRCMYCTVEANYWQTQNIARALGDSRASYIWQLPVRFKFSLQNVAVGAVLAGLVNSSAFSWWFRICLQSGYSEWVATATAPVNSCCSNVETFT